MRNLFLMSGLSLSALLLLGIFFWPKLASNVQAEAPDLEAQARAEALRLEHRWVDSLWSRMTEDEKIGQIFMLAAYPRHGKSDEAHVLKAIKEHHIGGLIFFHGPLQRVAQLGNLYQSQSRYPLLYAIDGEWGLNMRLDSTVVYPRQMALGAIKDLRWIYLFGRQIGRDLKRLGLHVNFAPVVDVNTNPANPVIGDRSFGEDRDEVVRRAFQYMQGMQDEGIMACAKHFPGHGDTEADSHYDLPKLRHNRQRLDSFELYPFRALSRLGIGSVMVAHLEVPALDSSPNRPTTLSYPVIQKLLKEEIGFQGLIFTDALNMAGATKHFKAGELDLQALIAGNDILLMPQDLETARKKIKAALKDGRFTWAQMEERVRKILHAKYRHGLAQYKPVDTERIAQDILNPQTQLLQAQLSLEALTLARYDGKSLPLQGKVASLSLNSHGATRFQQELQALGIKHHYQAPHNLLAGAKRKLQELEQFETVVVSLRLLSRSPLDQYNLSTSAIEFVRQLAQKTKVIVVGFGSPYALKFFDDLPNLLVAYNEESITQKVAAQALMGFHTINGQLPVSPSTKLLRGSGDSLPSRQMPLALSPEEVDMDSRILNKMDQIAAEMIREKAAPGCQVLVLRKDKVAFHRAYGHHLYDRKRAVALDDVYDLASVTKVAATTLALMKLYDEGKIDMKQTLGHYLPELRGSNKADLILGEVLAHQAGLKAWIPFYTKTLDEQKRPKKDFYRKEVQGEYCIRVANGMYMCQRDVDSLVWAKIYDSELLDDKKYVYSDLGLILSGRIVERLSGQPLDRYVYENFYKPMGLHEIGFRPLTWPGMSAQRIVPTEQDDYYRYALVHGDVHDMAAAMLGGVAGHAGLFATAQDLGSILNLLNNKGLYKDKTYIKPETIELFTKAYNPAVPRRGLGFDRKEQRDGRVINVPTQASDAIFGHLGFTGISAWVDPEKDLCFIFLSNRTYPAGTNMKLVKKDIRRRMHELCYEAIKN